MRVGIFPMTADLCHPGHIAALNEAKQHCDMLIVALNCNPTNGNPSKMRPVETVFERFYRLKNLHCVDAVIPYENEGDLLELLMLTDHDVRFVGGDYENKDFTGKAYEFEHNIDIVYIDRSHNLSSTNLKHRVIETIKSCYDSKLGGNK